MRSAFLVALTLILAACGQNPREAAQNLLNEGKRDEAIQVLEKAIAEGLDEDEAPMINGMAAELLTAKCVAADCPLKSANTLASIKKYLSAVKGPIPREEGVPPYDVYEKVFRNAARLISQKQSPESYSAFVSEALPANAPKARLVGMLMDEAYAEMNARRIDSATMVLNAVATTAEADSHFAKSAMYYSDILKGDLESAVKNGPIVFENAAPEELKKALSAIPFLYMSSVLVTEQDNTGEGFFKTMLTFFDSFGLGAHNTEPNQKQLALVFDEKAADETFVARLSEKVPPVQGFKNHQDYVKSRLIKLAIVYDASDEARWRRFFGPALANIALDQPLTFMYDNVELSGMPAQVIIDNNIEMLRRLQAMLDADIDIVAALKEIIYRSDAGQLNFTEQTNKLLAQAMGRALAGGQVDSLVNYITYEPTIIGNNGEKVIDLVTSSIEDSWQKNDFARMESLSNFLSTVMRTGFSLEVKLSELFSAYLASPEVADKLASSDPNDLLRSIEEARIDLNPKLNYTKEKFAGRPEIIQSRLRAAAVNADGPYGTANALLSLYDDLDKADRDKHLTTAIKLGISNDKDIPAYKLAKAGSALAERWKPEITYNFIINETLNRIKDLDDARKAWQEGSDKFRESAEKLRPQIASLMRGIDAFNAGDLKEAARRFMVITDPAYLRAAEPYLQEFRDAISKHAGTYAFTRTDENLHIATVEISPSDELLKANITLTSTVGMVIVNENFVENRGNVYRMRLIADINPETLALEIPLDQLLSQVDDMPVGRAFGRIKSIEMKDDKLFVVAEGDTKPYEFNRITNKVNTAIRPSGRYGIIGQVSKADPNLDHVLPVGSVLNITIADGMIQRNEEIPGGGSKVVSVYPVTGTLLHPATTEPLDIEGYYNPDKHTTEITYSYPMNDGRTVLDAIVRCHIITNRLICGAHNRHWSRQRYSHVVEGLQAK